MKLEILVSCMFEDVPELIRKSGITGDAVVIDQCDKESYEEFPSKDGMVKVYHTKERGLTRSRNKAIRAAAAEICMLCDDDEVFTPDYQRKIITAYEKVRDADIIIFKMLNRPPSFRNKVMRLRFPLTLKVSSWQISFKRKSLEEKNILFDKYLGAGTGNGAEEELKFLTDCEKAGLRIYYVPVEIASVGQESSTWFCGFTESFFYNRGATTRYILGMPLSSLYAIYYILAKKNMYSSNLSSWRAYCAIMKGIKDNRITKSVRKDKKGVRNE